MPIKIIKASAGSGKTFALAGEYLRRLLSTDTADAYRHILAVTFTNKATAEMKGRILDELHRLATDPASSPYIDDLKAVTGMCTALIRRKASEQMRGILNDYGAFSVSTIDGFFQKTLRSFSREIGRYASYQVELDRASLVDEAVSRVLESLDGEDPELLGWLRTDLQRDLRSTGRFLLEGRLRETASEVIARGRRKGYRSRKELATLAAVCDGVISSYTASVIDAASAVRDAFAHIGVDPADTNRGFAKAVVAYADIRDGETVTPPSAAVLQKAEDPDSWFPKTKAALAGAVSSEAVDAMHHFADLFSEQYKSYSTSAAIRSQVCSLGLEAEFVKAFTQVQRDRNVISIDESNAILRDIIDGTDAPFVYEKIGSRFTDFLLDEFQDTSDVQYENLLPLLRDSAAAGGEVFAVGDIKQSIYRWRGSDWSILGEKLPGAFGGFPVSEGVLGMNWRTDPEIVSFNNGFFRFAAAETDRLSGTDPALRGSATSIYADVEQTPAVKGGGFVHVSFAEDTEKEMLRIVETVAACRKDGWRWGDIAILLRGNAEVASVAAVLMDAGVPVTTDDALRVKASTIVSRVGAMLYAVLDPSSVDRGDVSAAIAREGGFKEVPLWHSLPDLVETLLAQARDADPGTFDAETAAVQAFADYVKDWSEKNGDSLSALLADWQQADPRMAAPDDADAVKVMTVHKAKGLEFPQVIVPYVEKISLYKSGSRWCRPAMPASGPLAEMKGEYNVTLSEASSRSYFASDYADERRLQGIENLNILYVALTRAKHGLHVIASMPPKAVTEAVEKGLAVPAKNYAHVLYAYIRSADYTAGEAVAAPEHKDATGHSSIIDTTYACSPETRRKRLVFKAPGK